MSLCLIISDTHLKPVMFDRAEKILESGQADFAVQLGDLVDDWDQGYNLGLYNKTLERVLAFHKKFPKTLWCMGNHDFGYYHPEYGKRETGHSQFVEREVSTYLTVFFDKAGVKQLPHHVCDTVIFSHAGVTKEWAHRWSSERNREEKADLDLFWGMDSPIWARPPYGEMWGGAKLHVVGHTPVKKIHQEGDVLLTDTWSTYSDGTQYGERKFAIVDTETGEWHYAEEEE